MIARYSAFVWTTFLLPAPAQALEVYECGEEHSALVAIVEPWHENSLSLGEEVRIALVDLIEPAFAAYYVVALMPDSESEMGRRACLALSPSRHVGFSSVDMDSLMGSYDPISGLDIDFSFTVYDPDADDGNSEPQQSHIRLNLIDGLINFTETSHPEDAQQVGASSSGSARFLGSWLPANNSGASRNDLETFNPDGTRTISDGSGFNALGHWSLENGQFYNENGSIDVELGAYGIKLNGILHERYQISDVSGTYLQDGFDPYGFFVAQEYEGNYEGEIRVGDYELHGIYMEPPELFSAYAAGSNGVTPPIMVEFWNRGEALKRSESGGAYREDVVRLYPHVYKVDSESLAFYGTHPLWGEVAFSGDLYSEAGRLDVADGPVISGTLTVKGHVFPDVDLWYEALH
jgi:hypothetical protein